MIHGNSAASTRKFKKVLSCGFVTGMISFAAACTPFHHMAAYHSDLRALAGVWVDSVKRSPTDTVAWRLDPNGADWTLEIHVVSDSGRAVRSEQRAKRYGYWYLDGAVSDTAGRMICFKKRPRDGGTCYPFRLDTLPATGKEVQLRRRLIVDGYAGEQHQRTRVLFERLP